MENEGSAFSELKKVWVVFKIFSMRINGNHNIQNLLESTSFCLIGHIILWWFTFSFKEELSSESAFMNGSNLNVESLSTIVIFVNKKIECVRSAKV